MSHESEVDLTSQGYPLPWSMSPGEHVPEAGSSGGLLQRTCTVGPDSTFNRWLREFRDERTGGISPPPMN